MIKIIEQGQKTFTRTCDRCGCKFQYDLSDLSGSDYISCPCCNTTLTHIGPHAKKVGPNDTDLSKSNKIDWIDAGKINVDDIKKHTTTTPYKVEVGDGGYNFGTTTGQYINPNTTITIGDINKPGSDSVMGEVDPNIKIYANKLPDDIVDDKYNNISMSLPDDVQDNCCYESDNYKAWYEKWCKEIKENAPIECKNEKYNN
jgi:hypothetical protein|uniref:Zinc-ribbon domain protein n=1 Tax=Siphoviridae sp. ctrgt10 TaxID=2826479 RepID=A0A8S5M7L7_9CAUD|nr:MAG TPA: zinc-ribbon domain protein [Siphoviridae sp. ctrgt10]